MTLTRLRPSFQGRVSRRQFWREWLTLLGVSLGSGLLAALVIVPPVLLTGRSFLTYEPILAWFGPAVGVILAPWVAAVLARRLHDLNRSGWWSLAPSCVMVLNSAAEVVEDRRGDFNPYQLELVGTPFLLLSLVGAIVVIVAGLLAGSAKPNRFGPPPADNHPPSRPEFAIFTS